MQTTAAIATSPPPAAPIRASAGVIPAGGFGASLVSALDAAMAGSAAGTGATGKPAAEGLANATQAPADPTVSAGECRAGIAAGPGPPPADGTGAGRRAGRRAAPRGPVRDHRRPTRAHPGRHLPPVPDTGDAPPPQDAAAAAAHAGPARPRGRKALKEDGADTGGADTAAQAPGDP